MDCDQATLFAKRATRKLLPRELRSEGVPTYHDVQSDVYWMLLQNDVPCPLQCYGVTLEAIQ